MSPACIELIYLAVYLVICTASIGQKDICRSGHDVPTDRILFTLSIRNWYFVHLVTLLFW